MRNKEIYERIADTYLGKNNNKKNNSQRKNKRWFISLTVINVLILFTVFFLYKFVLSNPRVKEGANNKTSAAVYILSQRYPIRLTYDLNPPRLGIKNFTFSLPLVDAGRFSFLKLRVRGDANFGFSALLKIDLKNQRSEKDSYYLKGISDRWQDFSIGLSEFKNITDWSNIAELSFVFEDWNVSEKTGILYIDNIRFSE